jgi:hypothetical protein
LRERDLKTHTVLEREREREREREKRGSVVNRMKRFDEEGQFY